MKKVVIALAALALTTVNSASAGWESSRTEHLVSITYEHDDGGALLVMCDPEKKLLFVGLQEPRAAWKPGEQIKLKLRTDGGTEVTANGVAAAPHSLIVREEATWLVSTAGDASRFFATGDGVHARIWPFEGFRNAMVAVLAACGDHW